MPTLSRATVQRLAEERALVLGALNLRPARCFVCGSRWAPARLRAVWFYARQLGYLCRSCCPAALVQNSPAVRIEGWRGPEEPGPKGP